MARRLGLVVNPIAGMGGPIGLKGSDGWTAADMVGLGAVARSGVRASLAVEQLRRLGGPDVLTAAGAMGEDPVADAGLTATIAYRPSFPATTSEDTRRAVRSFMGAGCDLILFAGGDGTARDVFSEVGQDAVVLGIPTGVKIHSAAFARSPAAAGDVAAAYVAGDVRGTREAEVVDLDEEAYRRGVVSVRLFGYLRVPDRADSLQGSKVRSTGDDEDIDGIGRGIAADMDAGVCYVIGPGTTAKAALRVLGLPYALLGVDLVVDRQVVASDLSAAELLAATTGRRTVVVVSPIGGQGYVFGRGNQQLSPELIRRAGEGGLVIAASPRKLASLRGRPLVVDTGDQALDRQLAGYVRVVTGRHREVVYALSD
jgi:predicted polyphosphate/ATP-dependent NAD kinase